MTGSADLGLCKKYKKINKATNEIETIFAVCNMQGRLCISKIQRTTTKIKSIHRL